MCGYVKAGLAKDRASTPKPSARSWRWLWIERQTSTIVCAWNSSNQKVMHLFGRQAIPMVWDFASEHAGRFGQTWSTCAEYVADCVEVLGASGGARGH